MGYNATLRYLYDSFTLDLRYSVKLAFSQFAMEDIGKWLDSWIASKDEHFYRNGIRASPERWAKVLANGGQYFD